MQLWKRKKSANPDKCPYVIVNGKRSVVYVHDAWALDSNDIEKDLEEDFSLVFEVDQERCAKLLVTLLDEVTKHVTV